MPDLLLDNSTGWLSRIGLLIGCVLAVVLVQRRSVFGPMVQPPLLPGRVNERADVVGGTVRRLIDAWRRRGSVDLA